MLLHEHLNKFKIAARTFADQLMEKFVDVRRLIISKNKKLLRWLPPFFIKWIERVIHQEEVNRYMNEFKDDNSFEFCAHSVEVLNLQLSIEGIENIPDTSTPVIFVSNHPLGGLDAIAIIHLLRDKRPDLHFIVNDLLMHVKQLKDRFIGVNKVGKSAAESLQLVEKQFASDTATFIFPAGLVSRKKKGKIVDLEWKKTFITKAKKYNKPVVPVYINGRLTNRFYRLANLRNFLGIKLNIEMFFLVDELFKQRNTRIDYIIGEPISPETFTKEQTDKEWADWVKARVYQLAT